MSNPGKIREARMRLEDRRVALELLLADMKPETIDTPEADAVYTALDLVQQAKADMLAALVEDPTAPATPDTTPRPFTTTAPERLAAAIKALEGTPCPPK